MQKCTQTIIEAVWSTEKKKNYKIEEKKQEFLPESYWWAAIEKKIWHMYNSNSETKTKHNIDATDYDADAEQKSMKWKNETKRNKLESEKSVWIWLNHWWNIKIFAQNIIINTAFLLK